MWCSNCGQARSIPFVRIGQVKRIRFVRRSSGLDYDAYRRARDDNVCPECQRRDPPTKENP